MRGLAAFHHFLPEEPPALGYSLLGPFSVGDGWCWWDPSGCLCSLSHLGYGGYGLEGLRQNREVSLSILVASPPESPVFSFRSISEVLRGSGYIVWTLFNTAVLYDPRPQLISMLLQSLHFMGDRLVNWVWGISPETRLPGHGAKCCQWWLPGYQTPEEVTANLCVHS